MRFHTYLLVSLLALGGGLSSLSGCGSNKSLGEGFPEDAGAGGIGGTTAVTTVTGGGSTAGGASAASTPVGGSSPVASSAAAGQTAGGSSAVAGKSATAGTSTGTAGAVAGKTASGGASGGRSDTGGTSAVGGTSVSSGGSSGSTGSGDGTGVILTATVLDTGTIQATWQNNTQASIFLYGCGTVDVYRKDSAGWTNIGKPLQCGWEGVSPEVKPGASLEDPAYGPFTKYWPKTGGIFRVSGKYGVGCTDPSAGQSKAGCTAFYQATSNEVTVTMPVPDAGVDGGCGEMVEGVTCKKPGGGCAAMTCSNGSWSCAPGQTPVALVPGACDISVDAAAAGS